MTDEPIWHVLVVTQNGTVSLLKNLTEDAARQTVQRLTPYWRRPDCNIGGMFTIQPSDAVRLEAFGPEGKVLDVWQLPDPGPIDTTIPLTNQSC